MNPQNTRRIVENLQVARQALADSIAIALVDDGATKRLRNALEKLIQQIDNQQERLS